MNTFQFTVSIDPAELRKTAGMLRAMADSLENSVVGAHVGEFAQIPGGGQPAAAFPPPAPPIPDFSPLPGVTGTQSPTSDYAADVPPIPPVPPAPVNPAGKELDKNGLPFDTRIHTAGENRRNKDGTWKYMRGLLTKMTQSDVDRIEAENRAAVAAPVAPVPAPSAPPTPVPVPPAPPTPAGAATSVPPTPAGTPSVTTWVQLNQACVTRGLGKDMMAADLGRLGPIFAGRGLTNFMSLYQRPDLIPAVMADISNTFPVVQ